MTSFGAYIVLTSTDKYKYKYIWTKYFRGIQVQIYTGYQNWENINTNSNILTDICKYECKYERLSHTKSLKIMLEKTKCIKRYSKKSSFVVFVLNCCTNAKAYVFSFFCFTNKNTDVF